MGRTNPRARIDACTFRKPNFGCTTEFATNFGAGTCPEQCVAGYFSAETKLVREFVEKVNGFDPIVEAGYKVGDKFPVINYEIFP